MPPPNLVENEFLDLEDLKVDNEIPIVGVPNILIDKDHYPIIFPLRRAKPTNQSDGKCFSVTVVRRAIRHWERRHL